MLKLNNIKQSTIDYYNLSSNFNSLPLKDKFKELNNKIQETDNFLYKEGLRRVYRSLILSDSGEGI